MLTPISRTAPEALDLVLSIPDDVYAPDFRDQPDPYGWREGEAETDIERARRERKVTVMPTPPAPRRSLREHVSDVDFIAETIETLDDEALTPALRDELSAQLVAALAGTKKKVDSTSQVLAMFEALANAAKAERERLDKRVAFFERQSERLELHVLAVLEASKLPRIDGETSTLARRANPAKVEILDAAAVPKEYLRYKAPPPPEPDKVSIGRDLKKQRDVPGARLAAPSYRLIRS